MFDYRIFIFEQNWCHSNPCQGKHEVCLVGFTERGFTCACREPWIEKQCTKGIIESAKHQPVSLKEFNAEKKDELSCKKAPLSFA